MKKIFIVCFFVSVTSVVASNAQPLRRLNSFSYNINEGLLQSSIVDMNFDGLGFMWLSYETGLQRYDGITFKNVAVQDGLADNQYIKFIKTRNGKLWLCHSKGVSVYNAVSNHFSSVFFYSSNAVMPAIWPVIEDNDVVYFYESDGYIIGINENTFKVVSRNRFPFATNRFELPEEFNTTGSLLNHEVIICFKNSTLIRWDLKRGVATRISELPDKIQINDEEFHALSDSECMFFKGGQLTVINIEKNAFTVLAKNPINPKSLDGVSFEHTNQSQILMSVNNELFQFNTATMRPVAKLVNFQNQPFAHFPIRYIRTDNFGNIYLVTRNEGFIKLFADTYPISYYGTDQRQFNFITFIEVDKKNNRILAGSLNGGLLVFDTLQKLQRHIEQIGQFQATGPLTIAGIVHVHNDDYLLFPRQNTNCILWNAVSNSFLRMPFQTRVEYAQDSAGLISKAIQYYSASIMLPHQRELLAIDQNFYEIDYSGKTPLIKAFLFTYRTKGLCSFKNYILSGTDEMLCFRDPQHYSFLKKILIPGSGEIRCISTYNDIIYVGSNHGLYKLTEDGKIIGSFTKKNGLPDDYIYSIAIDHSGNIWCSTNRGIIKISNGNSILHLKKEDGLQENEFNTNVAAKENDGELFFGGVNGINSFYPDKISNINDSPKVVVTNIRVNDNDSYKDSATWMMKQIDLPYNQNNLYFEFTVLGKRNAEQYFYQYKMSGIDKNWIQSADVRNARYLLPPGKYFFQLYAGDTYTDHPKNIKTIEIIISSPFWETWWFVAVMILFFVLMIVLIVRQYLNRRYQKKLAVLQFQNELQHERERISRDLHDNIGAQLSFISSSIDWVIDKNKEMNKEEELKQMNAINATAKNVMMNLRETIWALHKDKITLQEFSDKLKVYIQNMLQLQPQLQFKATEKIDKNFILTPAEMLNIFRICQESVNNVLKHANASLLKLVIYSEENSFHICIEDNGSGFDASTIPDEHYGLKNMKHRAMEANAKLSVKTEQGIGSVVEIDKYSK